jgi:hypothetical protein
MENMSMDMSIMDMDTDTTKRAVTIVTATDTVARDTAVGTDTDTDTDKDTSSNNNSKYIDDGGTGSIVDIYSSMHHDGIVSSDTSSLVVKKDLADIYRARYPYAIPMVQSTTSGKERTGLHGMNGRSTGLKGKALSMHSNANVSNDYYSHCVKMKKRWERRAVRAFEAAASKTGIVGVDDGGWVAGSRVQWVGEGALSVIKGGGMGSTLECT